MFRHVKGRAVSRFLGGVAIARQGSSALAYGLTVILRALGAVVIVSELWLASSPFLETQLTYLKAACVRA